MRPCQWYRHWTLGSWVMVVCTPLPNVRVIRLFGFYSGLSPFGFTVRFLRLLLRSINRCISTSPHRKSELGNLSVGIMSGFLRTNMFSVLCFMPNTAATSDVASFLLSSTMPPCIARYCSHVSTISHLTNGVNGLTKGIFCEFLSID